jgi:threonine/homoserine/homoserine lactone efflux protein
MTLHPSFQGGDYVSPFFSNPKAPLRLLSRFPSILTRTQQKIVFMQLMLISVLRLTVAFLSLSSQQDSV